MSKNISRLLISVIFLLGVFVPSLATAHCDGLDGPVVKAAQKALETGNVNPALVWVRENEEAEIEKAFQKTLTVRKLTPQARELADMYFFETLVRLHRAGEGEPYTGLKPAGRDLGPAIPAADTALESGKLEPLLKIAIEAVDAGIRDKFKETTAKKNFNPEDVQAGREYVEAYVLFLSYVERVYEAAKSPADGHLHEAGKGKGGLHKYE
jgi:hypothetical protein